MSKVEEIEVSTSNNKVHIKVNVKGCTAYVISTSRIIDASKTPAEFNVDTSYSILEVVVKCPGKILYKQIQNKTVLTIKSVSPLVIEVEEMNALRADIFAVVENREILIGTIYRGDTKFETDLIGLLERLGISTSEVYLKALFYYTDTIIESNKVKLPVPTRGSVEIGTGVAKIQWAPESNMLQAIPAEKEEIGTQYVINNTNSIVNLVMGYSKEYSSLVGFNPGSWPASFTYLKVSDWEITEAKPLIVKGGKDIYVGVAGGALPVRPKLAVLKPKEYSFQVEVEEKEVTFGTSQSTSGTQSTSEAGTSSSPQGTSGTQSPEKPPELVGALPERLAVRKSAEEVSTENKNETEEQKDNNYLLYVTDFTEFGVVTDKIENILKLASKMDEKGSRYLYIQLCTTECSQPFMFEAPEPWSIKSLVEWRRPIVYFELKPGMKKIEVKEGVSDQVYFEYPTVVYDGRLGIVTEEMSNLSTLYDPNGNAVKPGVRLAPELGYYTVVNAEETYVYYILREYEGDKLKIIVAEPDNKQAIAVFPRVNYNGKDYDVAGIVVLTKDSNGFWAYWVIRPVIVVKSFDIEGETVYVNLNVNPADYGLKLCNGNECVDYENGRYEFSTPIKVLYFDTDLPVVDTSGKPWVWIGLKDALNDVDFDMPYLEFDIEGLYRDTVNILLVVSSRGMKKIVPVHGQVEIYDGAEVNIAEYITDAEEIDSVIVYNSNGIRVFKINESINLPHIDVDSNYVSVNLYDWYGIATAYIEDCNGVVPFTDLYETSKIAISCGKVPVVYVKYKDKYILLDNGHYEKLLYEIMPTVNINHIKESRTVYITVSIPEGIRDQFMMLQVVKHPQGEPVAEYSDIEAVRESGIIRLSMPAEVGHYLILMWVGGRVLPVSRFSVLPEVYPFIDRVYVQGVELKDAEVYYFNPFTMEYAQYDREATEELRKNGYFTIRGVGRYILVFGKQYQIKLPVYVYGMQIKDGKLIVYDMFKHSYIYCALGCRGDKVYYDTNVAVFDLGFFPLVYIEMDTQKKWKLREELMVLYAFTIGALAGAGITLNSTEAGLNLFGGLNKL